VLRRLRFRTRLILVSTAITAIALLAFGELAQATVRWSLESSTAARLQTTATGLSDIPDERNGRLVMDADDRRQFAFLLSEDRMDGAVIATDGRIVYAGGRPVPDAVTAGLRGVPARSGTAHSGGFAYAWQPVRSKSGTFTGYVADWIPSAVNGEVMRITIASLVAAGLATIVVSALLGWLVIRRLLNPIVDLNALMSEIEVADVSERLDWDGPNDELGQLCSTFDRLLDRLGAAFERERRFTTDASHELRTPLSVMRAEIEFALSRTRDVATYHATLRRLHIEALRLQGLIDHLLATARGRTPAEGEPHALHAIAAHAVDGLRAIAGTRAIRLALAGDEHLATRLEPVLLQSALTALLDNAIRHTPGGGAVRIGVERAGDWALLSVADSGPGFSREALAHATERFWRDDAARAGEGSGLGLAIVAAFADRHGGSLVLRNDSGGGGAVVELRLPAEPAARDERVAEPV
jgi:two-component system OmpR family sensor kinase